jgi:hypothetical protein
MKWSERLIAGALARQVFQSKHLVIVPNCTWTGDELDLLIVTANLRIIDVEVKISRADLRADAKKSKWMFPESYEQYHYRRMCKRNGQPEPPRVRLEWPRSIWKHYYALPKDLWNDDIATHLKAMAPRSGVILMSRTNTGGIYADLTRRSQTNPRADKISAEAVINLARLASLRMWDAYKEIDNLTTARRTR